jgi:hypothetical protein
MRSQHLITKVGYQFMVLWLEESAHLIEFGKGHKGGA